VHQTPAPASGRPADAHGFGAQGPLYDDDDSGPPKLKRGIPAEVAAKRFEKKRAVTPEVATPEAAAVSIPKMPRIIHEKARSLR